MISAILIALFVFLVVRQTKKKQKQKRINFYLSDVDRMSGRDFEYCVATVLNRTGFGNVAVTKASGDFGVDIVATKDGARWVFQCKCYQNTLGLKPIQEVYSGAKMYGATRTVVVTNSYFSQNATELAQRLNVELWDRNILGELLLQSYVPERKMKPEQRIKWNIKDFENKIKRDWKVPVNNSDVIYIKMLKEPHVYFSGSQTKDRDAVRDGFIIAAAARTPTDINLVLLDLCGFYMRQCEKLPHTKAYTQDLEESLVILNNVKIIMNKRLSQLQNRMNNFSDLWVVIDGFEGLYFRYKSVFVSLISEILSSGTKVSVHLAAFSSYSEPEGGIDECFPSYVMLNGTANEKICRIIKEKKSLSLWNKMVYKNSKNECCEEEIPRVCDADISNIVSWWTKQI